MCTNLQVDTFENGALGRLKGQKGLQFHDIRMHYQTFSDVIGDQEDTFRIAVCEFMYGPCICRLHFENPSLNFRDLMGGGQPPTSGWVWAYFYRARVNSLSLALVEYYLRHLYGQRLAWHAFWWYKKWQTSQFGTSKACVQRPHLTYGVLHPCSRVTSTARRRWKTFTSNGPSRNQTYPLWAVKNVQCMLSFKTMTMK